MICHKWFFFFFFFKSAYLAFEISLTACFSLGNVGLSLKTEAKYKSLDWNRCIPKTLLMMMPVVLDQICVIK